MKPLLWLIWICITVLLLVYYGYTMVYSENKQALLVGEATHGHFQIELACSACHSEAFGGMDALQSACENCHQKELNEAHDSHPKKKFTDPRNADLLEIIDARYCVSCHKEHQKEQTRAMGLTLPEDYCFHCHKDIGAERSSHRDLGFDSCASAGCHNFHDNRALYESFLVDNAGGIWLKELARIAPASAAAVSSRQAMQSSPRLQQLASAMPARPTGDNEHWDDNSHLEAGVACAGCHQSNDSEDPAWLTAPSIEQCSQCHLQEAEGYKQGKHGMRLAQHLSNMQPKDSPMAFREQSLEQQHSCNSCHSAHAFDTRHAATAACLNCHNDDHSLAFRQSPHGQLADKVAAGSLPPDQQVSCANCHMPRIEITKAGKSLLRVEHNQNANLRPNEKMIRTVCLNCHNLAFSIDALADDALIKNNFNGRPGKHIPSIDWAMKRETRE